MIFSHYSDGGLVISNIMLLWQLVMNNNGSEVKLNIFLRLLTNENIVFMSKL